MDESSMIFDDEDTNDQNESLIATETPSATGSSKMRKIDEEEGLMDLGENLVGIDQAILQSIDKCGMCRFL